MSIRYFMFSKTQMVKKKEIEANIGRTYVPKTVIVNGTSKEYTEILDDPNKSRFSDAIVIISGDIDTIRYTK